MLLIFDYYYLKEGQLLKFILCQSCIKDAQNSFKKKMHILNTIIKLKAQNNFKIKKLNARIEL